MARSKLFMSLIAVIGVCVLAGTSLAKSAKPCPFTGNYSFYFWDPDEDLSGVGYISVLPTPGTDCRAGIILPGGIINCNYDDTYESYIEGGNVFLETDGEGTMLIETNGDAICDEYSALELDISVANGGKVVNFNSDGEEYAASGTILQTGYDVTLTGEMAKCYAADLKAGSYDLRFWEPDSDVVGDCTVTVSGTGYVTGGTCRCNNGSTSPYAFLSEIEGGTYTPGENCESSTGYMTFITSSDEVCGLTSTMILDYAVAAGGTEIFFGCDPDNDFNCAGRGNLM